LYGAEIQFVDENVGELLEEMKKLHIFEESLIVFVSDHGEEFWEHGAGHHGHTLYQELLHVPLLIRLPNAVVSRRIRSYVPVQAVLPTVLELCGMETPAEDGWSLPLTALLKKDSVDVYREPIVSAGTLEGEPRRSVVLEGLKYIVGLVSEREEVYDVEKDPEERINVFHEHPEFVKKARSVLADHERFADVLRKSYGLDSEGNPPPSAEMLRRLKSMGYIR
jgi:arylsulfatase A-like enzyme